MSVQVLDIYAGNRVDFDKEKATGTDGVIIKLGQGQYPQYFSEHCDFIDQAKRVGLPWGLYHVVDARYSPESQKAMLKASIPDGNFGPLGLWLDVEKPVITMTEAAYRKLPYAYYKTIESIAVSMLAHSKTGVGIYTSPGQWNLCAGLVPQAKAEWFATLPLWTAQYEVSKPQMYGAWTKYAMWQYQGEPDYSIADDEWFASKVGAVVEPPTIPPVVVQDESYRAGWNDCLDNLISLAGNSRKA